MHVTACQVAPSKYLAMALVMPPWLSETRKQTSGSPRRFEIP